jgi:periplasmic divalent cation tolerance protein
MSNTVLQAVCTTVATLDEARAMAHRLVQRRLAACVQLSPIESIYRWDDAVQQEPEVRLLCKTTAAGAPALHAAIRALHPYAVPAIFAVDINDAHPPFAQWVAEQTGGEQAAD